MVCKSVHHHTFKWINQQYAATSQVYYLSVKYSSACFRHPHAHHQELQQLQQQPLVYRRSLVVAVLLVVVGPAVIEYKMCVLIFSTTFVRNISHSKKNWERRDKKRILVYTDFRKILNIKFHENPSSRSRVVLCGRTDGHDESHSRFSLFWESA
jgi:hypothetical protein